MRRSIDNRARNFLFFSLRENSFVSMHHRAHTDVVYGSIEYDALRNCGGEHNIPPFAAGTGTAGTFCDT